MPSTVNQPQKTGISVSTKATASALTENANPGPAWSIKIGRMTMGVPTGPGAIGTRGESGSVGSDGASGGPRVVFVVAVGASPPTASDVLMIVPTAVDAAGLLVEVPLKITEFSERNEPSASPPPSRLKPTKAPADTASS